MCIDIRTQTHEQGYVIFLTLTHIIDQISEVKFQIKEPISNASKAAVMEPQVRDSIEMGFPSKDTLGKLNPDFQEPIFAPVELIKLDLEPLLKDDPEVLRLQITQAVQAAHNKSSQKVQALSSPSDSAIRAC